MAATLLTAAIACIVAAIVGGGLKAFGIEIPALASTRRQVALGIFGTALLAAAFVVSGGLTPWATRGSAPTGADSGSRADVGNASNCLSGAFGGVNASRVRHVESGASAFEVVAASEPKDSPMAVVIEENRQPVGAIAFDYFASSSMFKIRRVIDRTCEPVETFRNASRGGDKYVLQNWDTIETTIDADTYALRLGYADGAIEGTLTRIR